MKKRQGHLDPPLPACVSVGKWPYSSAVHQGGGCDDYKTLILSGMVSGDGALGRKLGLEGGSLMMGLVPF